MIRKNKKLLVTLTLVMAFVLTIGMTASASEMSILDRYLSGDLAENSSITKGQAVEAIVDHFNYDVPAKVEEANFENLEGKNLRYAEAALMANLVEEPSDYDLDQKLRREEFASMLMKATRIKEDVDTDVLDKYADLSKIDSDYKDEIALAVEMGILVGDGENQLLPDEEITLAEVDALISRLENDYKQIDVLSTNDFHGKVQEGDEPGAAKLMGAITHYRKANQDGSFVVDGGDSFQGTPISNLNDGDPVSKFMNLAGYVGQAIGNHEFDWGTEKVSYFDKKTNFPMMAANIVYKDSGKRVEWATPTKMLEIDGVKIGLVGIATPQSRGTVMPSNIEDIEFTDPAKAINVWSSRLKDDGADMVIAVTHMPGYMDEETGELSGELIENAEKVKIDGLVGGHSHHEVTGIVNGNSVVEAGKHGRYLGNLRFFVDEDESKVYNAQPLVHPVQDNVIDIEKSDTVQKVVDSYSEELEEQMEETIITTEEELVSEYNEVSKIGSLVTEAMLNVASADVAFQNPGGLRIDIPAGDVTVGHMYELLPFGNSIVTAEMTGEQIIKVLEQSLTLDKGMLQHTGLVVEYDMDKEKYNRVVNVTLPDGTPLEKDKTYTVATNNFLGEGGDGFKTFTEVEFTNTNVLVRDALLNYLREMDTIDVDADSRAIEVDESASIDLDFAA